MTITEARVALLFPILIVTSPSVVYRTSSKLGSPDIILLVHCFGLIIALHPIFLIDPFASVVPRGNIGTPQKTLDSTILLFHNILIARGNKWHPPHDKHLLLSWTLACTHTHTRLT